MELDMLKVSLLLSGLLMVCVFLFVGFIARMFLRKPLKRCSERASGKVIGIDRYQVRWRYRTDTFYRPLIEYRVGSEVIQTLASHGDRQSQYEVGDLVFLYYNPYDVNEILIKHEYEAMVRKGRFIFTIVIVCVAFFATTMILLPFLLIDRFL